MPKKKVPELELTVVGANPHEIQEIIWPVFAQFMHSCPDKTEISLVLDVSNIAAVRGVMEYQTEYDDFLSTATGANVIQVSEILINDIQNKITSWKKAA
jgi:creatinine amidohydrolase/Fe(II)-dependent formamide hydrolase-like protein